MVRKGDGRCNTAQLRRNLADSGGRYAAFSGSGEPWRFDRRAAVGLAGHPAFPRVLRIGNRSGAGALSIDLSRVRPQETQGWRFLLQQGPLYPMQSDLVARVRYVQIGLVPWL